MFAVGGEADVIRQIADMPSNGAKTMAVMGAKYQILERKTLL
jgi:hypothetical protein